MASINDYGKSDIESLAQPKLGGTDGWAAAVAAALDGSDETVNQRISILRDQLETADTTKVAKAGDTMTGPLTLPGNPTNALHAATKGYVDAKRQAVVYDFGLVTTSADGTYTMNAPAGYFTGAMMPVVSGWGDHPVIAKVVNGGTSTQQIIMVVYANTLAPAGNVTVRLAAIAAPA